MSVELLEVKHLEVGEEKLKFQSSHIEHHVPQVPRNTEVIEVANADYALALSTAPQLSPKSLRSLQLYLILLVPFMSSLSYGFDGSVMGAVSGMKSYLSYFHIGAVDAAGGPGTLTALIFGMHTIGSIAGLTIAAPMADKFGRRGGMFVGSVIIIVGAIVCMVAKNTNYLLGGRFVLGLGVTVTTTAAPIYVVEMSPPQWRGRLTGLYNTFYSIGTILCMVIADATGGFSGSTSWRVPLAIQIAPAAILAISVFSLPESPRWLVSIGRKAEARHILTKYHGDEDEKSPLVLLEWKEIEEAVKVDGSDKRWWDYSGLFNTPNARKRTILVELMGFFGQRSSNTIGYFLSILLNNIGAKVREQKLIGFAGVIIAIVGALVGTSLVDKVGRRALWFWGMCVATGILAIVIGCVANWGVVGADPQGSKATIAFFLVLGFVASVTYTPLQVLYPAECLEYNTRAKGMALYTLALITGSLADTYAGPIAISQIHWKYLAISIPVYIGQCALIWHFVVETKGRTLEEMNEVFEDPHSVKASLSKHTITIQEKSGGLVILNLEPLTTVETSRV